MYVVNNSYFKGGGMHIVNSFIKGNIGILGGDI